MKKILLLLLAFLYFISPSFAKNFYIENYDIDVSVSIDGVCHVKESMDVYCKNECRDVFRRDISTEYAHIKNFRATSLYSIDKSYKYWDLEFRVPYYGSKNYQLEYDYILSPNFTNKNEFYYTLIGNGLDTEVKNLNFRISMPKPISSETVEVISNKKINFETAKYTIEGNASFPHSGLGVKISLPDNYFSKKNQQLPQNCIFYTILLTFPSVLFWYICGKEDKITPVVNFKPPKGMTAAHISTIYKNRVPEDWFSLLILSLASEKYLNIVEYEDDYELIKLKEYDGINREVKIFFNTLFDEENGNSVFLNKIRKSPKFKTAKDIFENSLEYFRKSIFNKKLVSAKLPVICSLTTFFIFLYAANNYTLKSDALIMILFVFFWIIWFYLTIIFVLTNVCSGIIILPVVIFLSVMTVIAVIEVIKSGLFRTFFSVPSITALLGFIISVICIFNLPKRNKKGIKLLNHILGFRKFIETTEKRELELLCQQKPDYIPYLLPYAYALEINGILMDTISYQSKIERYKVYNGFKNNSNM